MSEGLCAEDWAWWCRDCEGYKPWHTRPRSGDRFCTECGTTCALVPDTRPLRSQLSAATARASELEKIVAAGDRLCVAAVRCGIHTWSSIPPEGLHRALQFGVRMHEYINASPTFEWPFDDGASNVTAKEARDIAKGDRATKGKPERGKTDG